MKKSVLMIAAFSLLCGAVFAADDAKVSAAPAAPAEVVQLDESMKNIEVPKKAPAGLVGDKWLRSWGLTGSGGIVDGKAAINNGVMYRWTFSNKDAAQIFKVEISAFSQTGKSGKLNGYFSGCIREKGDKKPFSHELRKNFGPFELTADPKTYTFEIKTAAWEQGYFYIGGSDILIGSIKIVATPAK